MKVYEAEIWTRFLRQTELEFLDITYDLHLGKGVPWLPVEPEYMKRLKLAVTRKRVDAVAETADDVWIFEVKPRIGLSALGQLLAYFELYQREYGADQSIMLGAVGYDIEPDIQETFELHAVNTFLVTRAG